MEIEVLYLLAFVVGLTLLVDFFWWIETRDRRVGVEKTTKACDGRQRTPSGLFAAACPQRAVYARGDKHFCLSVECDRGQS